MTASASPLRVAVIGAGPSGFFLADRLLASGTPVSVDLYERLPTPYGLVRFGVAPDHEKIKNVTRSFDRTAARPGFRYFGNVEIGRDVTLDDLRRFYHAIAFATGAQTDRRMDIPGEDLAGSHAATEFVAWYNGHPDYRDRSFGLDAEHVVVIGVGNVAVDVARILCRTPDELAATDLADHALDALRQSRVRSVTLLGRRGPAQAAFTPPEVKELGDLPGADVQALAEEVALDPLSAADVDRADDAATTRKVETLAAFAGRTPTGKGRQLTLRFLVSPVELLGDTAGRVRAVRVVRNRLVRRGESLRPEPTEEFEDLPAQLVFRSVGYRGVAIPGLPFHEAHGVVPNTQGRVMGPEGPIRGMFVTGWIKRGPSGVIGTNKPDAAETATAILEDAAAGNVLAPAHPDPADAARFVLDRCPDAIDWSRWTRLDAVETEAGRQTGRPRRKLCSTGEMLEATRSGTA